MQKEKPQLINEFHLNRHQPDKPQFAIHDLNAYINKNIPHTTKPHIHSYYQIIWFKKGNGKHYVDFNAYDVFDNAFFFISRNQVHYFDQHTDYEGFLIHFNEAFLAKNEDETDFFLKFAFFNSPNQQPSCCLGKDIDNTLDEYIVQIKKEMETALDFGKEELLRNYLKSFLIQIQRKTNLLNQHQSAGNTLLDEKRIQMVKLTKLIDEHYNKGYSVSEYARLLFISPRTLSDLTHQMINKTPSQMIQERIVLEAQRLLLYSPFNVNQIAYRLGFDDPSYFVKYFRKHVQLSPSEFRKSVV